MSAVAVETAGLGVAYDGRDALADVDLAVRAGAITTLIGPSGCGKTSFLTCLNRLTDLVPGCRVRGSVRVEGKDARAADVDLVALRRRVGMIFQKPNPFPASVRQNLDLPLRGNGHRGRADRAVVAERALRDVGLWDEVKDRLDAPATALSGGQQQRLCIARALALEPRILLMDEPCSALDPLASGVVEDLITDLRGRYTVIVVTHDLAQARRIADDAAFFWMRGGAGALIESGSAADVFGNPKNALTRAFVEGTR